MASAVRNFWKSICTKWYEDYFDKKKPELDEFKALKVKWYGAICMWGIGNLFFGNGLSAMKKVKDSHPEAWHTYGCVLYFLLGFILMGAGGAAAALPSCGTERDVELELAGTGAWVSILCAVGCYHLATYEFHPPPQDTYALCSLIITSFLVSVFWACTAQDPRFLHVFVKLLGYIFFRVPFWICSFLLRLLIFHIPGFIWRLLVGMSMWIGAMVMSAVRHVWAFSRARAGYHIIP